MTTPSRRLDPSAPGASPCAFEAKRPPMLIPQAALRLLCRRTGGTISRTTFYRWLGSGVVPSIRLGKRIFISRPAIEAVIQKCFAVD
jgi:hypothetical protein